MFANVYSRFAGSGSLLEMHLTLPLPAADGEDFINSRHYLRYPDMWRWAKHLK
jgi:hypothetical protein